MIYRYKRIYTYPKGTYLFNTYTSTLEQESIDPIQVPYNVFLADNSVKTSLSVHKIEKEIPNKSYNETTVASVTSTSVSEDLLILTFTTILDRLRCNFRLISENYVRDKHLDPQPLDNPLRIRLADGSTSIARTGSTLTIYIGNCTITRKFIITRSAGQHRTNLGYLFLENT